MTIKELIAKLRTMPPNHSVIVQFNNEGEWGGFDEMSEIRSVAWRKLKGGKVALIRCYDTRIR